MAVGALPLLLAVVLRLRRIAGRRLAATRAIARCWRAAAALTVIAAASLVAITAVRNGGPFAIARGIPRRLTATGIRRWEVWIRGGIRGDVGMRLHTLGAAASSRTTTFGHVSML